MVWKKDVIYIEEQIIEKSLLHQNIINKNLVHQILRDLPLDLCIRNANGSRLVVSWAVAYSLSWYTSHFIIYISFCIIYIENLR